MKLTDLKCVIVVSVLTHVLGVLGLSLVGGTREERVVASPPASGGTTVELTFFPQEIVSANLSELAAAQVVAAPAAVPGTESSRVEPGPGPVLRSDPAPLLPAATSAAEVNSDWLEENVLSRPDPVEPLPGKVTPGAPAKLSADGPATAIASNDSASADRQPAGINLNAQTSALGESPAGYLFTPSPVYPKAARQRHQQGLVLLNVLVTARGRPARIAVAQSSGFHLLDQAAIRAVRRWRFAEARSGPGAIDSNVQVPVVFKLTPGETAGSEGILKTFANNSNGS